MRKRAISLCLLLLAAMLAGCGSDPGGEESGSPDPIPSQSVYAATGRDNDAVEKNGYQPDAFIQVGGFTVYTGADGASHIGVDVSAHQGEVDWEQVAGAGVSFAMLRVGYRGYTEGGLFQDAYFEANIQGALAAGLRVGVYFFSQATDEAEAEEEARQVVEWIAPYRVTYPVVFNWEPIPHDEARTDGVSAETVTRCARAFCDAVEAAGHVPMVYFNKNQGYDVMDLEQLEDYHFWLASYTDFPDFAYHFEMWQYSCTGTVPGISTPVDLDLCLVDYPEPEPEEDPDPPEEGAEGEGPSPQPG